jgi:hypothetical protein
MSLHTSIFSASARLLRKVAKPRRFNRRKAAGPLLRKMTTYWQDGLTALFAHLDETEAWDTIHRHTRLADTAKAVRKELTLTEKRLLAELLAGFDYYGDVEKQAADILALTTFDTFESAAVFALGQIGVKAADFTLRNEGIKTALLARKSAAVFASKKNIDSVMETVLTNFYELGRNPYDAAFLKELRSELGDVTTWQAKRFALTETAIAAELAQHETWSRNGVTRKQWNILGDKTRPSHQRMSEVQAEIEKPYVVTSDDGSSYECLHPCDPKLPAHELINCHCWSTPVVNDDFQIDPSRIWEGE